MTAQILDGRKSSAEAKEKIRKEVEALKGKGIKPMLAVVLVGEDPASKVYARQKEKNCEKVGVAFHLFALPESVGEEEVVQVVEKLNADDRIHGILVEMPLPKHISNERIQEAIAPEKDVDGVNPLNFGRFISGLPALRPCTPQGAMYLMESHGVEFEGKNAVVVGRSNIVGKPMVQLLLEKNATVTVCHSRTRDLAGITRRADILVAAVGRPKMITGDMIKPGAVVVDVGINSTDEGLVGDVDFDSASEVASWISPVPGGVGPLTIAMLLRNVVESAKRTRKEPVQEK